jgi:ankyrin repeat protein
MNKYLFQTCIVTACISGFAITSSAQTDFDNWNGIGSFDTPSQTKPATPPTLAIPDPKEQKKAEDVKNQIDTKLKVETPKDIPIINIPMAPEPKVEDTVAPEKVEPIKPTQTTKKSKIKPVEIKNNSQAKKTTEPTRFMAGDQLNNSISSIFEENKVLEDSYKPTGNETRRKFEHKQVPPKFLQRTEFNDANKHLPKVVYQKQYSELLFAAIQKDDVGALNTLLHNGADINAKFTENGYTALMYAIQTKNLRTVRYLITRGANLNIQGTDGKTALHLAAASNNVDIFTTMIKSGAKPFTTDYIGKYPLDYVAAPLKEQFETIVAQAEPDKNQALFSFVTKGSIQPVSHLIEEGADLNIRDKNGDTPLMIAVRKNDTQMTNFLLSKGASTIPMNNAGEHALGIAQKNGNLDLATIIDTITIKKELEAGVARRVTQPIKAAPTLVSTPVVKEEPKVEIKAIEPVKTEEVKIEEPKKKIPFITVVEEEPKQEQKEGFFASMGKSLTSVKNRMFGESENTPAAKVADSEVVTEKLPELTTKIEAKPQVEVYSKKSKLPPHIVKKTLIDGKDVVMDETGNLGPVQDNMQPMSIMPQ